ncbi:hypothetical protein IC744_15560 [Microbacterium hominis]|uniref:hypothetical protein n=1 Tax=Microbacterium hominis TaxID=162426 RepID=UPI00168AF8BB|nr:hypothetical protein [Microbacterium hominis]QOC28743.1 hypothetical protein IC744_15560 [Microbacterium hominis]
MKLQKFAAIGAAVGVALAGFGVSAAHADPVTDGYSIVGSDTLQDAVSALANGTNITGPSVKATGAGKALASWDAFALGVTGGVGKIQTKPFGPTFDRPNGSGAGRNALLASIGGVGGNSFTYNNVNIKDQVDLARSSSVSGTQGSVLTYIPFGQDAISFVFKVGASGSGDAAAAKDWVSGLSSAQLKSIYTSTSASPVAAGSSGYVVKPLAIQSSSGTWTTFLSKIGVTSIGSGVDTRNNSIPENDGTVLTPGTDEIQLIPVSVANYIGQVNGASRINTFNAATLVGTIDGLPSPFTGTLSFNGTARTSTLVPNSDFYNSASWGRTVYIVVPTAKLSDAGLGELLDTSSPQSLTYWGTSNSPATTKAVKLKFGFAKPVGDTVTRNG